MNEDFELDIDRILADFISGDSGEKTEIYENEPLPWEHEIPVIEVPEQETAEKAAKQKSSAAKTGRSGELPGPLHAFFGLLAFAASIFLVLWLTVNVHPGEGSSGTGQKISAANFAPLLDNGMNNAKADALSGLAAIKKIYKIPESAASAPEPDPGGYGTFSVSQAAEVLRVIDQARYYGLLGEDEETVFSPDADFYYDSDIEYYLDETILAICWKEVIDGNTCSFSEVKIADASQFRRKFVNDTFSADAQDYATNIAASVNAVVAMNADFYGFRDFGMIVYQRNLLRFSDSVYLGDYKKYNCVDTMFVDSSGDFRFFHRLEQSSEEAMEEYIRDEDIVFSIAFGPVLVEDGVLQSCDWYPAGEVNSGYSRAGIGQTGKLHYLYMSLNHSNEKAARWTVNEFAAHFYEKGVVNAYCLDGGQTSEIVFRGKPYNYIDFNAERTVTDIIYFATALPDGGD